MFIYSQISLYRHCKRCGQLTDDGTKDYCLDCLDEIYEENKAKCDIDIDGYPTFDEIEGVHFKDVL